MAAKTQTKDEKELQENQEMNLKELEAQCRKILKVIDELKLAQKTLLEVQTEADALLFELYEASERIGVRVV